MDGPFSPTNAPLAPVHPFKPAALAAVRPEKRNKIVENKFFVGVESGSKW